MGLEEFYSAPQNEVYKDIQVPFCFSYLFDIFLEMYSFSGQDGITWQGMESYCKMRKLSLSQMDIDYIIKIRSWTADEIAKMRDDVKTGDKDGE